MEVMEEGAGEEQEEEQLLWHLAQHFQPPAW